MSARAVARRLATLPSDRPDEIRQYVVGVLREAVSNELGLFFDCVEHAGECIFTTILPDGDEDAAAAIKRVEGTPAVDLPWLPSLVHPATINHFISVRRFYPDEFTFAIPVMKTLLLPLGVSDQLRALMYDGPRFIGWIGLLRRGPLTTQFREAEVATLERVVDEVKAALVVARARQDEALEDGICAVCDATGAIEHASPAFDKWLTPDRHGYLRLWTRAFDAGTDTTVSRVLSGAEVRMMRVDGAGGVRYMITVDRAEMLRLRPRYWLTPRQLEVAELAVGGATNADVARVLDVSPETVKSHLKTIYDRLGVTNRLELNHALDA